MNGDWSKQDDLILLGDVGYLADRGITFTSAFIDSSTIKVLVIILAPIGFSVICS